MKEHKKLEDCRLPILDILSTVVVPELQSFKDTKIKAKMLTRNKEIKWNQSNSITIDQICDVTYIAFRSDE